MKKVFFFVPVCLVLVGCLGEGAVPQGDPRNHVVTKLRGHKFQPDAMVATNERYYWAQEVFDGYRRSRDADLPRAIKVIPSSSCTPKAPEAGAYVAHVNISNGQQDSSLYEFSRRDVGKRAKQLIKSYVASQGRSSRVSSYRGSDGLKLVNVAVTKSDQPVHLILTSQMGVLWNIQKSDEAEISGISVIGPRGAGLANVPEGTEIEGLFGQVLRSCRIVPARMPKDHWSFVEYAIENPRKSNQRLLSQNYARAGTYARWLQQSFGLVGSRTVIDPMAVGNVLIGDAPTDPGMRIAYRPIKDATVHISRNDYVFAASRADYGERITKLVTDAAEQAIGGDLKTLLRGS